MNKSDLDQILNDGEQFKEIWLEGPKEQRICVLTNGNIGWLMYLGFEGDTGYSSRNPAVTTNNKIEFCLSNGQCDEYPESWTYPLETIKTALYSFIDNGELPEQVKWHKDS